MVKSQNTKKQHILALKVSRAETEMVKAVAEHFGISKSAVIRAAMCLYLPDVVEMMRKAKAAKTED